MMTIYLFWCPWFWINQLIPRYRHTCHSQDHSLWSPSFLHLSDVPGTPGKPTCTDSDKDFIKIHWSAPRSTGGSPITGYDVERCGIHSGRWKKVNRTPVKGTDFVDDTVSEGEQYQYRIVANNKMGPSNPSDPSQPIAAKPMKGKFPLNISQILCSVFTKLLGSFYSRVMC